MTRDLVDEEAHQVALEQTRWWRGQKICPCEALTALGRDPDDTATWALVRAAVAAVWRALPINEVLP